MVKQLTMPVMTRLILVTNGIGRDFPKWNKLNPAGIISGTGIDPGKRPAAKSGWCTYNLSTQYILWPAWLLPIQQENDSTTGDGPSSYTLVNMPGSATHSLPLVHFVVVLTWCCFSGLQTRCLAVRIPLYINFYNILEEIISYRRLKNRCTILLFITFTVYIWGHLDLTHLIVESSSAAVFCLYPFLISFTLNA